MSQPHFDGTLYCLHGFLGRSLDWDAVIPAHLKKVALDLFSSAPQSRPSLDLVSFPEVVNQAAQVEKRPRVLVGYSLGGRIALHALVSDPKSWSGAVIISAHPGLSDLSEKATRKMKDEDWAQSFETESWGELMTRWNSQAVFEGSEPRQRIEAEFSRRSLAEALRTCSLGVQRDLRPEIRSLNIPILWVVGEQDQKFLGLARDVAQLNPLVDLEVLPGATHRAPWDRPDDFARCLDNFFGRIRRGESSVS